MTRLTLILCGLALVSCKNEQELKTEQYFAEGYQLYTQYCANCHQADGSGLSNLYPPLKNASILSDKVRISCIMVYGMNDTILVNGKKFSRPMPGNPKLTELEVAELATFVNLKWGKDSVFTPVETVRSALQNCQSQGPVNL